MSNSSNCGFARNCLSGNLLWFTFIISIPEFIYFVNSFMEKSISYLFSFLAYFSSISPAYLVLETSLQSFCCSIITCFKIVRMSWFETHEIVENSLIANFFRSENSRLFFSRRCLYFQRRQFRLLYFQKIVNLETMQCGRPATTCPLCLVCWIIIVNCTLAHTFSTYFHRRRPGV